MLRFLIMGRIRDLFMSEPLFHRNQIETELF
jgi:hypothetical protein